LRIFGSKMEEEIGGQRKLNNDELHNLFTSKYRLLEDQIKED